MPPGVTALDPRSTRLDPASISPHKLDNLVIFAYMRNREVAKSAPTDLFTGLNQSFYSPAEVARLAGLHPSTILSYIHSGRLYAIKLSERTYRIPNKAVLKMLAPELATPPRHIERPYAKVDLSEGDREPERPWPDG